MPDEYGLRIASAHDISQQVRADDVVNQLAVQLDIHGKFVVESGESLDKPIQLFNHGSIEVAGISLVI